MTIEDSEEYKAAVRQAILRKSDRWRTETIEYSTRIAALRFVDDALAETLERFPGLIRMPSSERLAVKHRSLVLANQLLSSAGELLGSIQFLWPSGHFLAAGHCIRLLYEIWGVLVYARDRILKRADESEEVAKLVDARLQRLLLGTNSGPALPAGLTMTIDVVNVNEFIRAGAKVFDTFQEQYDFLCDISHPTFMHWYLGGITYEVMWSNELAVKERHRILERVTNIAEAATAGIRQAMMDIYEHSLPEIQAEVAGYK